MVKSLLQPPLMRLSVFGPIQLKDILRSSRATLHQLRALPSPVTVPCFSLVQMTKHSKFSKSMIGSFNSQLMPMQTGFALASSHLIPDSLFRDQMIVPWSFGTLHRNLWLWASMTMKALLTQSNSTLMEHVLPVVALINQLKYGTFVARDSFSTTMLIKIQSIRLPSILMAATFFQHRMTRQLRSGTWDKVTFFILCMVTKAHHTLLTSHHVETTSARLESIQLSWSGRATWVSKTKSLLRILETWHQEAIICKLQG